MLVVDEENPAKTQLAGGSGLPDRPQPPSFRIHHLKHVGEVVLEVFLFGCSS